MFHQSSYSVNENDRSVQPVLVLSGPASTNITVTVKSTDISAEGKDTITIHDYASMQNNYICTCNYASGNCAGIILRILKLLNILKLFQNNG